LCRHWAWRRGASLGPASERTSGAAPGPWTTAAVAAAGPSGRVPADPGAPALFRAQPAADEPGVGGGSGAAGPAAAAGAGTSGEARNCGGVAGRDAAAPGTAAAATSVAAGGTPFADAAGDAFSEPSMREPAGAHAAGAGSGAGAGATAAHAPSGRGPELDPFDIAAHSAVPPAALTPAASAAGVPPAGAEHPAASPARGGLAGAPGGGRDVLSNGGLAAGPAAPAGARPPPPLTPGPPSDGARGGEPGSPEVADGSAGAGQAGVEGAVRVTAEFSPLGSGPMGLAALQERRALKRGPSPPPAAPPLAVARQAVH